MSEFMDEFTGMRAARYELTVKPDKSGWRARLYAVDLGTGERSEILADSTATTKEQAVIGAYSAALGQTLDLLWPRFCQNCDDGESIQRQHDEAVEPFRLSDKRAVGRSDAHDGKLVCWSCLEAKR